MVDVGGGFVITPQKKRTLQDIIDYVTPPEKIARPRRSNTSSSSGGETRLDVIFDDVADSGDDDHDDIEPDDDAAFAEGGYDSTLQNLLDDLASGLEPKWGALLAMLIAEYIIFNMSVEDGVDLQLFLVMMSEDEVQEMLATNHSGPGVAYTQETARRIVCTVSDMLRDMNMA